MKPLPGYGHVGRAVACAPVNSLSVRRAPLLNSTSTSSGTCQAGRSDYPTIHHLYITADLEICPPNAPIPRLMLLVYQFSSCLSEHTLTPALFIREATYMDWAFAIHLLLLRRAHL